MHPLLSNFRRSSRRPAALLGLAVLAPLATAVLVACGGGSTSNGIPTNGLSASVARGTLTGFGSIYVDGIEYDDSGATVTDDDGNVAPASALRIGMQVELTGEDKSGAAAMGSAATVVFNSDLVGPVGAVDAAARTITILGQTVDVNPLTAWDAALAGGLSGLAAGQVLKVYSMYDAATGRYSASRIEADAGAASYKLRGLVSNLDTTAKTYTDGTTLIDYSAVATPPTGLADGAVVVAELQTASGPAGWSATALRLRNDGVPGEHVTIHVRGLIATEVGATSFTLDGWPVDASGAQFPSGQSAIVAGALVQVDGIMTKGVLVASSVDLQQPGSHGGLDFQLHGPIQSIDTTASTLVLRGQAVSYAGSVTFSGGSAADLAVGSRVLVQGTLSADGTSVQAVDIAIGQ